MKPFLFLIVFVVAAVATRAEFNSSFSAPDSTYCGETYGVGGDAEENEQYSYVEVYIYKGGYLIASGGGWGSAGASTSDSGGGDYSADMTSGNGDSASHGVTTTYLGDIQAPTVPGSLVASSPTTNTAALAWSASTDACSGVSSYEIRRDGAIVGSSSSTSFTLTGLQVGSTYSLEVRAVDGSSNVSDPGTLSYTHNLPSPTITFSNLSKAYGDASFTLSSTSNSGSTPSYSILNQTPAGVVSLSGSTVNILGVGSATFRVNYPATNTHLAGFADATLTIVKGAQTISFTTIADRAYGDPPFAISPTSSGALPVSVVVSGPALIIGSNVTVAGVGSVSITASQPGNNYYLAAPDVTRTFNVTKAGQTLTFGSIANRTLGERPFSLSPSSSSNLPVTLSVVSGPAAIANKTVTLTGAGAVTIAASQSGNAYYLAATTVTQMFTVLADTTPPSAPSNLATSNLAPTAVRLTWTASNDNIAVTGYEVSGFGASPRLVAGASVLLALTPQTAYTFAVRARDTAGNWSPSTTVSLTTPPDTSGAADADTDGALDRIEDLLGTNKSVPGADGSNQTQLNPHRPN